jgi:hypothetical protein
MSCISYSAGLVSLIRLSMDILSEATILNPYCVIVLWASLSSAAVRTTGTPIWMKEKKIVEVFCV